MLSAAVGHGCSAAQLEPTLCCGVVLMYEAPRVQPAHSRPCLLWSVVWLVCLLLKSRLCRGTVELR